MNPKYKYWVSPEARYDIENVSDPKSLRILLEKHFPEAFFDPFKLYDELRINQPLMYKSFADKYSKGIISDPPYIYKQPDGSYTLTPPKMKPFNLEKALSGEPVVTRHGAIVSQLTLFKVHHECVYPLLGVPDGLKDVHRWTKDGIYETNLGQERGMDLFMAPVKKKGWLNIIPSNYNMEGCIMTVPSRAIWESEEIAKTQSSEGQITVSIEWEG